MSNGCEYQCTKISDEDRPDPGPANFIDANCDGIDGDISKAVFVATQGSDVNPGTMDAPMRSLAAALARAKNTGKTELYVAGGTYNVTETFQLEDGISIYGGYSYPSWERVHAQRVRIQHNGNVNSDGDIGPIGIVGISGRNLKSAIILDRVDIVTPAAQPRTSVSNYAFFCADCDDLTLRFVQLTAGDGGSGEDGSEGAKGDNGDDGKPGQNGHCDESASRGGGAGGESECGRGGGKGGDGGARGRNPGSSGQPGQLSTAGGGGGAAPGCNGDKDGGAGQTYSGPAPVVGSAGQRGRASSPSTDGWSGGDATSGGEGEHGHGGGGGGGGGGQGGTLCINGTGAGGGGGGGGGGASTGSGSKCQFTWMPDITIWRSSRSLSRAADGRRKTSSKRTNTPTLMPAPTLPPSTACTARPPPSSSSGPLMSSK